MITDAFDNQSESITQPWCDVTKIDTDACIITFSYRVLQAVIDKYHCQEVAVMHSACGSTPIYMFRYEYKRLAVFMSYLGAPAAVGLLEESRSFINTTNYIVFGGAGCLNKEIARGKIMIPAAAYRDEGTSYHYAPASDYIDIPNFDTVSAVLSKHNIPVIVGKTWTTDAFYRETRNNFNKRKQEGCISVEMECAALQACCDFHNLELYTFFSAGDLLDAPEWDERRNVVDDTGTQHDLVLFEIALLVAAAL